MEGSLETQEGPDLEESERTTEGKVRGLRKHVTLGMLLDDGNVSAFGDRVVTRPGTRGVWLRGALQ